jgi:hypothetical protein
LPDAKLLPYSTKEKDIAPHAYKPALRSQVCQKIFLSLLPAAQFMILGERIFLANPCLLLHSANGWSLSGK